MRLYSRSMATNTVRRRKASAASGDIFDLMGRSENIREAAEAMQANLDTHIPRLREIADKLYSRWIQGLEQ